YQMESSSRLRLIDHGDTPNLLKALSSAIDASSGKWLARMDTDDPYGEFEQCAPYAVNVQIKTEMKTPKKGVLAHADLQRVAQILKNANYRGNVVMEYEEEDSYDGVPGAMDKLRTYFGG
ncbi:MAG: sugar phosphate isomerase/epimerase, partial [Akkermansiaceae bacterium]